MMQNPADPPLEIFPMDLFHKIVKTVNNAILILFVIMIANGYSFHLREQGTVQCTNDLTWHTGQDNMEKGTNI
jgi:hypothetical protein